MKNILKSRLFTGLLFLFVTVIVILSIVLDRCWKVSWWTLSDEFFAFMTAFCLFVSALVEKMNRGVASKLQICAAVCGFMIIVALIVEYFLING